jgi:N utilization substance protein B
MGKRRKAREGALQILYQIEFDDSEPESIVDQFWKGNKAPADVKSYSRWLVLPIVDRNILRLAVYELINEEDLAPAIVINESLEIAKKFSSDQAAQFINGILDAFRRQPERIKELMKEDPNG